jgi:hypothetical protein
MKATIISKEVPIAESTEKKTEPFGSAADALAAERTP